MPSPGQFTRSASSRVSWVIVSPQWSPLACAGGAGLWNAATVPTTAKKRGRDKLNPFRELLRTNSILGAHRTSVHRIPPPKSSLRDCEIAGTMDVGGTPMATDQATVTDDILATRHAAGTRNPDAPPGSAPARQDCARRIAYFV